MVSSDQTVELNMAKQCFAEQQTIETGISIATRADYLNTLPEGAQSTYRDWEETFAIRKAFPYVWFMTPEGWLQPETDSYFPLKKDAPCITSDAAKPILYYGSPQDIVPTLAEVMGIKETRDTLGVPFSKNQIDEMMAFTGRAIEALPSIMEAAQLRYCEEQNSSRPQKKIATVSATVPPTGPEGSVPRKTYR